MAELYRWTLIHLCIKRDMADLRHVRPFEIHRVIVGRRNGLNNGLTSQVELRFSIPFNDCSFKPTRYTRNIIKQWTDLISRIHLHFAYLALTCDDNIRKNLWWSCFHPLYDLYILNSKGGLRQNYNFSYSQRWIEENEQVLSAIQRLGFLVCGVLCRWPVEI